MTDPVIAAPAVAPTVSRVVPAGGSTAGNYPVTITGSGFLDPAQVSIGGNLAGDVQVLSDSMITATAPGGLAGPAEVQVTNTGTGLSGSATGQFSYFTPGPPTTAPVIDTLAIAGDPTVGSDLVTEVTATGDPAPSLSFQWAAGPAAGGPWTPIPSATAAGFVPGAAQVGQFLQVTATAGNGVNPDAESSVATVSAVAGLPAQVGDVGVAGTAELGRTLTAVAHGVTGDPDPTLGYQWQARGDSGWQSIAGATASQFSPAAAQVDEQLRVAVTATNGVGSAATSVSPATRPVRGTAPTIGGARVSGDGQVGGTLTSEVAGVEGVPAPRLRYQWQRGSGSVGSWRDIPGADSNSLTVPTVAAGSSVRVVVKAFNGVDPRAWSFSNAVTVPAVAPAIGKVVVAGKPQIRKTLTADARSVTGDPAPKVTYQWQRKGSKKWRAIRAAAGMTLTVRRAWYRDRLRVAVTASSPGHGTATKVSAATPKVRSARPQVTAITPSRGSVGGGTSVRIVGDGFMPAARVRIGGARCTVRSLERQRITCTTAPRRVGRVAVIVRNADGRDAVLPKSYRYAAH